MTADAEHRVGVPWWWWLDLDWEIELLLLEDEPGGGQPPDADRPNGVRR